jgi:hypothetical protein
VWEKLSAANPRLFDGPILASLNIDAGSGEILARRDSYARLAVQPEVMTGVRLLSVTAVCLGKDAGGREHVYLGKRGDNVRIYPRMWEVGPSGGLDEPPQALDELDEEAVFSHLADEAMEEAGLFLPHGRCVAICRDHAASSDDIVFVCEFSEEIRPHEQGTTTGERQDHWEYSRGAWVPVDALSAWMTENAGQTIAATRALFRALGWV